MWVFSIWNILYSDDSITCFSVYKIVAGGGKVGISELTISSGGKNPLGNPLKLYDVSIMNGRTDGLYDCIMNVITGFITQL